MKLEKGFYSELVKLAVPVTVQSLLVATLGIADVMMVGALGDAPVAAVGLASKLHFVTLLLVFGFSSACNVLVSQYVGAKQFHKIKQTIALTLASGTLMLFPVFLMFLISPSSWLVYIIGDLHVVTLTESFLVITALVVVLMPTIMAFETALRALGQTTAPLIFGALSIAVNIVLNYVLIFGKWGAPAMGVEGAAWATLISRILQFILILGYLYLRKHAVALWREDFAHLKVVKAWRNFLTFSFPMAMNFVLWGFGSSVYHMIAARIGTEPLAVMSVLAPVEGIVISTFVGFSSAASILLGRSLGANDFDYAWTLKTFFVRNAVALGVICGGILWFSKSLILTPFNNLAPETYELVIQTFTVLSVLVWIKVHNMMAMVSVLRSGGDNKWCLKIDIVSMWVLGIPTTIIVGLVLQLPFQFVFMAMFVEEVIKMIACNWRMHQKIWMRNLTDVIAQK